MIDSKISRRNFLKLSAATTTLVASSSLVGFKEWSEKHVMASENAEIKQVPSMCNGCSNKCGIIGYVKNGRLWKVTGHPDYPASKGLVCGRGHGFTMIAYGNDRVTEPLKRVRDGKFEPISWEQAYKEIAEKLNKIIKEDGPSAISLTEDPRPSGTFYSKRFITALGSPNYYTHGTSCYLSRDTGYLHTLGGTPSADVGSAKYIMFIGRSYADGITPSAVNGLAKAKENGTKIIIVDPRLNNTGNLATEWLPIRPGTDLALILGMSHVLVKENLYDKEFIKKYSVGFEKYAKELEKYTPEWAEEKTGISAENITRIAMEMANEKPKAFIEPGWKAAYGCCYENSTETARAIALFNAMLGNIQQVGGIFFGTGVMLGSLDPQKHPAPPMPTEKKFGAEEFPLSIQDAGVATMVPKKAMEGKIRAAIFNHSNAAHNYANSKYMKKALSKMDLVVTIDIRMSETAYLSDYVLPDTSYIERDEIVTGISGKVPGIAMRQKMVEKIHPKTKPIDQIFTELAEACGVGQYFNFTLDELNEALLKPTGISYKELRKKGTILFPDKSLVLGTVPALNTPSKKVEFYSEAFKKAGFSPIVQWVEPKVSPDKDSFRLITGKQGIHTHSMSMNIPILLQVTKDYDLERIWINPSRAKALGIKDGDWVEVISDEASSKVRAKVTERIHPEAIFVPSPYGITSPYMKNAVGIGFNYMDHVPFDFEARSGASNIEEVIVKVRKVKS